MSDILANALRPPARDQLQINPRLAPPASPRSLLSPAPFFQQLCMRMLNVAVQHIVQALDVFSDM